MALMKIAIKIEPPLTYADVLKEDLQKEVLSDILEQMKIIERAVKAADNRLAQRVLRELPKTRRKLNDLIIKKIVLAMFWGKRPSDSIDKREILFDLKLRNVKFRVYPRYISWKRKLHFFPESEIYAFLLLLVFLIDTNRFDLGFKYGTRMVQRLLHMRHRPLDLISAKCIFYYSRVCELSNKMDSIRSFLLSRLQSAVLYQALETRAMLINCLLRNYVHCNLYQQAEKLAAKANFPDEATPNQCAKYLYYTGRVKLIRLEYSDAHRSLVSAFRKAPKSVIALGFRQTLSKLMVIVELLLGEIPERGQFMQAEMRRSLAPYFHLTKTVLNGDISAFSSILQQYAEVFVKDKNLNLVMRLRRNVFRLGIMRLGRIYSRISLDDVATKLQLDSAGDVEYVIAKAIRDGIIEAQIDHEQGVVVTKPTVDLYATDEPIRAFHSRITFCMEIYRESVEAMEFKQKSDEKDFDF